MQIKHTEIAHSQKQFAPWVRARNCMQAHLAAVEGQRHPAIAIRSRGVLIGRGRDAERAEAAEAGLDYVHVGWKQVSAKQCRIVKIDGTWCLEQDVSSKNGVYHNDAPLPIGPGQPVALAPGDRIHLVNEVSTQTRTVRVSYIFQLGEPATPLGPDEGDVLLPRLDTEARTEPNRLIDLQCHMCTELAVNAVRIEPCGHATCAGCLEQWFTSLRGQGCGLKCPFGYCKVIPQRVVEAREVSERAEAEIARKPDLEPEDREAQASMKLPGSLDVFWPPARGFADTEGGFVDWDDREAVLEAVRENGRALEYASNELRNDREVVLEAVRQTGQALEYASNELCNDREFMLEVARQNGSAQDSGGNEPQNDREGRGCM